MSTCHEDAAHLAVERVLRDDPAAGPILMEYLENMRTRYYGEMMDVVYQYPEQWNYVDIYDAFAFSQVWAQIANGDVLRSTLRISCAPEADRCVDENNAALANLPVPFQARFAPQRGRGADHDGEVSWTEPIVAWRDDAPDVPWMVHPGQLPLEVGTTKPTRTWMHVFSDRGVARWPYGMSKITLLLLRCAPQQNSLFRRSTFACEPWPRDMPLPANLTYEPSSHTPPQPLSGERFSEHLERLLVDSLRSVRAARLVRNG